MTITTPTKADTGSRLGKSGKQLVRAGALASALAGIAVAAAAPAQATVYYSLHAWYDYSSASARSTAGEYTQSWAVHGNRYAVSGWYNGNSWAWADSGWSSYYGAGIRVL